MSYPKLQPGDPMYDFVTTAQKDGQWVCDSRDHNEDCSNPDCPVWGTSDFARQGQKRIRDDVMKIWNEARLKAGIPSS